MYILFRNMYFIFKRIFYLETCILFRDVYSIQV